MKTSILRTGRVPVVMLCLLGAILFAGTALAQVNGAIYTTTADATKVDGNIYASKDAVYLSGGPQNKKDAGLSPDGYYYFQVTDPSGAVLLSLDDVKCRVVVVTGGRVTGVPAATDDAGGFGSPSCYHNVGTANDANGALPVQLCGATGCPGALPANGDLRSYFDTPNPGGEYKAWMTPVTDFGAACSPSHQSYGFCDARSKTDNFKVKKASAGYVTVCKFNDLDGSGTQDAGEPFIAYWPITAEGVDTLTGPIGRVDTQTGADGCVSFSVSTFNEGTATVILTEKARPDWIETAPLDGSYDGGSVAGFVETITVAPGQTVSAPNFGNVCVSSECGGHDLVVTKDANPSFTRTFKWTITKSADAATVYSVGGGPATVNYTVDLSAEGTDSDFIATGHIKVSNLNPVDLTGVNVADAVDNGGACEVVGGTDLTIPAESSISLPYTCTYEAMPAAGTNTASATWADDNTAAGTAAVDFSLAAIKAVDGTVTVTDVLDNGEPVTLGTVSYNSESKSFQYAQTYTDPAGTCTTHVNVAHFTTDSTATSESSQTVKVQDCQGADLTVSKTATPAFTRTYGWNIAKNVDKTLVEQANGNVTFNYTVNAQETGFADSAWTVTGTITVSNPNDWQDVTADVSDAVNDGGACTVAGGSGVKVPAGGAVELGYLCTYASAPNPAAGTNTATATWDKDAHHTPSASATGTASFEFTAPTTTVNRTITVTDTFNGVTTTLGTLTATDAVPFASATYTYAHTVGNAAGGTCKAYNNTAVITETEQSSSQSVTVCNTATGALTMGFWQNKNGQGIIKSGAAVSGVCVSGTWLRQYAPFQDLSAAATCSQTANYVLNVIKAANASGAAMNAMLKAQMLASSLDVFFSDPALGGNRINAATAIGGVKIDLTKVCAMLSGGGGTSTCSGNYQNVSAAFGGATSLTVSQLLAYAASQSNVGGSFWYGQVKAIQELAKNTFDAINNQAAWIAP